MKQSVKKLVMLLALTGMISGCAYQFSSTNSTASSSSSKSTSSSEPVINCEHDYVYYAENMITNSYLQRVVKVNGVHMLPITNPNKIVEVLNEGFETF